MIFFLLLFLVAFFSSLSAIILLRPFAIKIGLIDKPTIRKIHKGEVPLIGGVSVYIGLLVVGIIILIFSPEHVERLITYLFASLLMVITGALDDRYDLSVKIRIIVQLLIASIMMFVAGDVIFSLGDLFSFGELTLGYFAYPFTAFAVVGAINAYNMVDGIDGLIGGMSVSAFFSLSLLFFHSGNMGEAFFCLLCLAVLIPYLLCNLQLTKLCRKKIFMGDAGSMFIGFTVVWLLAIGSQSHTLGSVNEAPVFPPVAALWIIALPLMDMTAIMIRRIKKGFSPFRPDRDHLHHIFMRAGFNSRETLILLTVFSFFLGLIGVIFTIFVIPDWIQLVLFLVLFFAYNYSLSRIWWLLTVYRKVIAYKRLVKRRYQKKR